MQFLFTTQPATGHFHPLAPLAEALEAAGHGVDFACGPGFCAEVERAGFRAHPAGPDVFTFPHAQIEAMALDVFATCRTVRPDAIVRDGTEFGGCLAAECLDLPHASVQVGSICPPEAPWLLVGAELSRARRALGLPDQSPFAMLYRHLHLSAMPPTLARLGFVPPTTQGLRFLPYEGTDGDELPAWIESAARPLVYATVGTVANALPGLLEAVLAGLRRGPHSLLVTVGRDQDPTRLGPQPATVHVRRFVSHRQVMPRCDLVVSHGGYGTVLAALAAGVPLVLVPVLGDQFETARRCAVLGVGRVVRSLPPDPWELAACVDEVLGDPSYAARACRLRTEVAGMPGLDRALALLTSLVDGRR
ncbi:glycosyltransferase [Geodermatophilus sp. SYSU D00697]